MVALPPGKRAEAPRHHKGLETMTTTRNLATGHAYTTQRIAQLDATLFATTHTSTQFATVYMVPGKIDMGLTGPDWEPNAARRYYATIELNGTTKQATTKFAPTQTAALEALLDVLIEGAKPVATLQRAMVMDKTGPAWRCHMVDGTEVVSTLPGPGSLVLRAALHLVDRAPAMKATAASLTHGTYSVVFAYHENGGKGRMVNTMPSLNVPCLNLDHAFEVANAYNSGAGIL